MGKFIDETGKKYGNLLVLSRAEDKINIAHNKYRRRVMWLCKCLLCNSNINVYSNSLRHKTRACYNCAIKIENSSIERVNALKKAGSISGIKKRKGTNNISATFWCRIKRNSIRKAKNLDFNITIEYIQDLLEKQNFTCAISGVPIILERDNTFYLKGRRDLNTASLDRIDSNKGYIIGNVQWTHKLVNIMKFDLDEKEFKYWCKIISEYNKNG